MRYKHCLLEAETKHRQSWDVAYFAIKKTGADKSPERQTDRWLIQAIQRPKTTHLCVNTDI